MKFDVLKQQKGFLLLDIIIAVFVIGVALMGIAAMFIQSSKATRDSAKLMQEADIAQAKIRDLQGKTWADLTTNWTDAGEQSEASIDAKDKKAYKYTLKKPAQRTDLEKNGNVLQLEVIVRREDETQGHSYIALYTNPN